MLSPNKGKKLLHVTDLRQLIKKVEPNNSFKIGLEV